MIQYFVADDADGDVWLWKGDRDGECYPVVWQRGLDNEDPALWPALLRGLGVEATGA